MYANSFPPFDNIVEKCEETDSKLLERRHFQKIVDAFKQYKTHSVRRIVLSEKAYNDLPRRHQEMIPDYLDHLHKIRLCVHHNYEVIKQIVANADHIFVNTEHAVQQVHSDDVVSEMDMDKVRTTLRQFVRDWSEEGSTERTLCYQPVIDDITAEFSADTCDVSSVNILVPGAGLGRLTFELASRGYACQGNEWSLFMLFASNFILNTCQEVNAFSIYPWVHELCNNRSNTDQIRPVHFPDVNPSNLPTGSEFSMAAGDFLEIYQEPNCWDCVATVFFIDTAHNIIAYIETIFNILRPGGCWFNLGPLLYHYTDMKGESSIELSYEDLKRVIVQVGFVFEKEVMSVKSGYTQNNRSMLRYEYDSAYFVCRKPTADPMSAT